MEEDEAYVPVYHCETVNFKDVLIHEQVLTSEADANKDVAYHVDLDTGIVKEISYYESYRTAVCR